jgi:ribulose-phosphate 3-epimerase
MTAPLREFIGATAPVISVGIMSADLMRLGEQIETLSQCGVSMLHFDIMDGCFCPQLTAGPFFVKGIRTTLYKDVHLMVVDPLPLIPEFAAAGADLITVHAESGRHVHRALQCIAEQKHAADTSRGILRGIACNPGTPLAAIEPFADEIDAIFLVAVNPGFPRQRFIEATGRTFESLKKIAKALPRPPLLGIDGGITRENIGRAASLGPHIIVTGSAVFENGNIRENCDSIRRNIHKG